MATSKLTLKLVVDRSSHKVLFAEADKDVVDFLFGLLTLPLGSVIKLLSADGEVHQNKSGCIANLYKSLHALDEYYFLTAQAKSSVIHATSPIFPFPNQCLLPAAQPAPFPYGKSLFSCTNSGNSRSDRIGMYGTISMSECTNYSDVCGAKCPSCSTGMLKEMTFVPTASSGYVDRMVVFVVMDDLSSSPMSSDFFIPLLRKFYGKDVGALEEKTVDLGPDKALQLLKASLQSKTVLTDVFLGERKSEANESTEGSEKEEKTESTEDFDFSLYH